MGEAEKVAGGCFGVVLVIVAGCVLAVGACAVWFGGTYSSLNGGKQAVNEAWGNVESDLQRRNDLIPNLVATVQGYATHEQETLEEVTKARSKAGTIDMSNVVSNPEAMANLSKVQGELSGALSRLMVIQERYPELKADRGFIDLQAQLEGTENRITVARQRYNGAVRPYNTTVHGLLGQFVANMFGFKDAEFFKADEGAKVAPKVSFAKEAPAAKPAAEAPLKETKGIGTSDASSTSK